MSQIDDFLNDSSPAAPAANNAAAPAKKTTSEIDSFLSNAPSPARGITGMARDLAAWGVKGAIGVPEAAVGLADIVSGGRVGKALENEGGALGFRPKQAREAVNEWHSDATKDAQRKFQDAEGIGGKFQAAIENPSNIVGAVVESLPAMGGGAVAARGMLGATRLGQMGVKGATIAGAAGEGVMMAGSQAEAIRQETPDGLLTPAQAGIAAATGGIGGLIGGASGRFANKLGIGDADTMLAQGAKGLARQNAEEAAAAAANPLAATAAKSVPRQVIEGAITEGFLEELPQSVAEQLLQNLALDKPWSEGLDEAIVLGVLSGGAMGAGAAGYRGITRPGEIAPGAAPAAEPPSGAPGATGAAGAPDAPAPTPVLLLGNEPDNTLVGFPDGSVGRKSDVDAYLNSLPENERFAAQAKLLNLSPQPADPVAPVAPPAPINPGLERVRAAFNAQLAALQEQEAGAAEVPQTAPPDGAAILQQQRAAQEQARQAQIEASRAEAGPDDEIYQSTGADVAPIPIRRSEAMGLDPALGGLTAAAATAVDSGASDAMQAAAVQAQAVDEAGAKPATSPQESTNAQATPQEPAGAQVNAGAPVDAAAPVPAVGAAAADDAGRGAADSGAYAPGAAGQSAATAAAPGSTNAPTGNVGDAGRDASDALKNTPNQPQVQAQQAQSATKAGAINGTQADQTQQTGAQPAQAGAAQAGPGQGAGLSPAAPARPASLPVVLQNRDRNTAASIAQMNAITAKPDYLRTGQSRTMDQGAPVVFGDTPISAVLGRAETVVDGRGDRISTRYAVMEAADLLTSNSADGTTNADYSTGTPGKLRAVAGNGRGAGLIEGYKRGTTGAYRAELEQDAQAVGIDPARVRAMKSPVLVRVMDEADVTPDIGDRSNTVATARLSPVEEAANDGQRIDLAAIEFGDNGEPMAKSIAGFVQSMPESERGNMLNADGTHTRQATDRLMAAVFKQAYGSDALVQLYAQATDPEARAVMSALAQAAGPMAQLKNAGEFDMRGAVAEAAGMAVNAVRRGQKLSDVVKNIDLDTSPDTYIVAEFMAQNMRSAKAMGEGLRNLAHKALEQVGIALDNALQQGMFGAQPTLTRANLLDLLKDNNAKQPATAAQQDRPEPDAQLAQPEGAQRPGKGAGPQSGGQRGAEPGREGGQDAALTQSAPAQDQDSRPKNLQEGIAQARSRRQAASNPAAPVQQRAQDAEATPWADMTPEQAPAAIDSEAKAGALPPTEIRTGDKVVVAGDTYTVTGPLKEGKKSVGVIASREDENNPYRTRQVFLRGGDAIRAKMAAQAQAPELQLTAPTKDDVLAQQEAQEAAEKQKAKSNAAAAAAEKAARTKKEIDARMDASADNFVLGQDADDSLSGQEAMFSRATDKDQTHAEVRNLVTLHNLTEENLLHADAMGGIPVPSIGITKVDSPFGGFGAITLIAPKGMVDPETGVPVYDRDAWTARYPQMNFKKVAAKKADAFYERMKPAKLLGDDGDSFMSMLWERLKNDGTQSPDKVLDLLRRYQAARMLYAKEVLGKDIKVPMRDVPVSGPLVQDKQLLAYWRANKAALVSMNNEMSTPDFHATPEFRQLSERVEEALERAWPNEDRPGKREALRKTFREVLFDEDGLLNSSAFRDLERDAAKVGTKEIDRMKLGAAVDKVVKRDDAGFEAWAKQLVAPLFDAPTITVRGREVEPTLENIVDAMTVGATAGVEKSMTFGAGKTAAMLGKRFKSLKEIQAARDQVVSQQQEEEGKKATDQMLDAYRNAVAPFYTEKDWRGQIDTWAANDASMEALAKAGKAGASDAAIRAQLSRLGFKGVDAQAVALARQAIDAIRNTATDYFEAKPQRAVKLDEFRGAVVPKGTSAAAIAVLEKQGITVEVHSKAEGAREKAIQKLAKRLDKENKDVLFDRSAQQPSTPTADSNERLAATQMLVDGLVENWTRMPEVIVARNMQDPLVPQRVRDYDAKLQSQGADGQARGFIYGGKVYLLSDKLKGPEQIAEVLFHEVLGHYGLRGAFGESLTPILQQMGTMRRADVLKKAREYGMVSKQLGDAEAWAAMSAKDRQSAAEEVLAEMAETQPNHGFVKRAISAIRNWLRANVPGFKDLALTDADIIQAYILPARGFVTRSKETGTQSLERAMTAFSREGAGDQVQTEAFKKWFGRSLVREPMTSSKEKLEDKKPLVVYHATNADFSVFESGRSTVNSTTFGDVATERHGIFFAEDPSFSEGYGKGDGQQVMPVYLKIESPIEMADGIDREDLASIVRNSGGDIAASHFDGLNADDLWSAFDGEFGAKFVAAAKKAGFDGALMTESDPQSGESRHVWVAFSPEQIKSATGNNGDFDGSNPDIRFSRAKLADLAARVTGAAPGPTAIETSMGAMTPEQEAAYRNVAGVRKVPSLKERMDAMRANLGLRMKQALVDQFAPIRDVSQQAYMLARMSKGSDGAIDALLMYGKPFLRDGVLDVNTQDGGFAKMLSGLKGEHDRFFMWVAAQRGERLKAEGKENLMGDDDISALKTLNAGKMADGTVRLPLYAKALQDLNAFNEAALKVALESGLIDQDAYDLMKDQPYVPFYRLMEEEGGMTGRRFSSGLLNQKAWQKLRGGTQQINADLVQNALQNWSHLYAASARNRAALATMDAAEGLGVAYKTNPSAKGAVKVMRDGMTEHWLVEDPYLLEAISAISYQSSPLMKPLARAKSLLTFGVTVNPTFKIRNLIRDSLSAISQSELGYNPLKNVGAGWKLTASDSQVYASMLASGGVIKFGTQENTDRLRDKVAKLGGVVLDEKGLGKFTGQLKSLYDVYAEFGDRTENINRAALYDQLIKKGYGHAEASFMARDLMDFSMGGSHPAVRFLTQTVPFLNARLQGLYKLGRAANENPKRFATMAAAVSLASLVLLGAHGDDDDWKKREDWDRDAYWWFKVGGTAYRIPKPFELGAIGTLAERTAEAMLDDEMTGKRFMQRIGHMAGQTFSLDPVPQAFKPLLDIYANKDSFTGRAIESQADRRLRPQDRYNERTTEVAKLLGGLGLPDPGQLVKGDYTPLSPKQVDHLIRGYFSWLGVATATAADFAVRPVLDRGERPDMRLRDVFLAGNFVESLPTGSSRYVSQLYEQSRSVEQAYASYREAIKLGDMPKAEQIKADNAEKIRSHAAFANATQQLSKINAQAKRIEASRDLSGTEKRARLEALEQQRDAVARRTSRLSPA